MEKIDKGNGVYEIKLNDNNEPIRWGAVNYVRDLVELHIPDGAKVLDDEAFKFCSALSKVYLPSSIEKLGNSTFYAISDTVEIYYDGPSEKFKELAKPYKKRVQVQVPGEYDVQPYCNTAGTYYVTREEWQSFDSFCRDCQVICNDGVRLYYGYKKR